ncbi:hypothetical protein GGR33_003584 [Methylobacterium brachythecii]|uniref:Uncharacterized protein n=1 Tax=Methylobacterium brachythecii TaxID=1176177 RepID=A0A7W6F862_9HYPH|nr:hypothetical protein [Methylobacterium brachythecii]MBB3904070.1 hypothetical protein [Methylobacterium brachythecii]
MVLGQFAELRQEYAIRKRGDEPTTDLVGEPRLADASRSHDGHEPGATQEPLDLRHLRRSADQARDSVRQAAGRSALGQIGMELHLPLDRIRSEQKAVAASELGREQVPVGAERLPERRDLRLEIVLLDDRPAPDLLDELVFFDQTAAGFDEHAEEIESARSQLYPVVPSHEDTHLRVDAVASKPVSQPVGLA